MTEPAKDVSDKEAEAYARIVGALAALDGLTLVCEKMIEANKVEPNGQVAKWVAEARKYRPKQ